MSFLCIFTVATKRKIEKNNYVSIAKLTKQRVVTNSNSRKLEHLFRTVLDRGLFEKTKNNKRRIDDLTFEKTNNKAIIDLNKQTYQKKRISPTHAFLFMTIEKMLLIHLGLLFEKRLLAFFKSIFMLFNYRSYLFELPLTNWNYLVILKIHQKKF